MEETDDEEDEGQAYIDGLRYQGQVTENVDSCIAVALHLIGTSNEDVSKQGQQGLRERAKEMLEEAQEGIIALREVQTNLGVDLCEHAKISRDRFDKALTDISRYATENFATLKEKILSGLDATNQPNPNQESDPSQESGVLVDDLRRELAQANEKYRALQQERLDSEKLMQQKLDDSQDRYIALLEKTASSRLTGRKKAAAEASTKRSAPGAPQPPLPLHDADIQSKNSKKVSVRIVTRKDSSLENNIVCGEAPFILGAVSLLIKNAREAVPLHTTFAKLCKILRSNQLLAVTAAEHDAKMAKSRVIDYGSTYDTITKQADRTEKQRATSIGEGSTYETLKATYDELTDVLVEIEPALKKLQDDEKLDDLREKIKARLRGYLKYRKDIDTLLSTLSKFCSVDHLLRQVTMDQVLSDVDVVSAWGLYSKFSETVPLLLPVFQDITVSDFRPVLNRALRSSDPTDKEKAIRLTTSISTGLREKKRKEILPAWTDAQNACPQTGEVATPKETSGLFIDNGTLAKSNTQSLRQCMAVRAHLLQALDYPISLIFAANNIDMKGLDGIGEFVLFLPSEDLGKGGVGLLENPVTYQGIFNGTDNLIQTPENVGKLENLVTKAAKNKRALTKYMAFINLAGSQEERESTAQVYLDILEPFRNVSGNADEEQL